MTDKYDEIALRLAQLAGARHQSDHVYATQIAAALRQAGTEERAACVEAIRSVGNVGLDEPLTVAEGYCRAKDDCVSAIESRGAQEGDGK